MCNMATYLATYLAFAPSIGLGNPFIMQARRKPHQIAHWQSNLGATNKHNESLQLIVYAQCRLLLVCFSALLPTFGVI